MPPLLRVSKYNILGSDFPILSDFQKQQTNSILPSSDKDGTLSIATLNRRAEQDSVVEAPSIETEQEQVSVELPEIAAFEAATPSSTFNFAGSQLAIHALGKSEVLG